MLRRWWLFLILLTACSSAAQPSLSAEQVAQQAAKAMAEVRSLHFVIELSGRLTYVDTQGALGLKRAEGDLVAPDKVRATIKTVTLGINSEFGVVGIGAQQWATNPLNNRWQTLPPELGSFNLAALFDAEVGIAGLLRAQQWTLGPSTNPLSLRATVDGAQLSPATSGMITKGQVDVMLQIDPASFLVTNVSLIERDTSPDRPTTWQISLSKPNATVEIVAPPVE